MPFPSASTARRQRRRTRRFMAEISRLMLLNRKGSSMPHAPPSDAFRFSILRFRHRSDFVLTCRIFLNFPWLTLMPVDGRDNTFIFNDFLSRNGLHFATALSLSPPTPTSRHAPLAITPPHGRFCRHTPPPPPPLLQ